MPTNGSTFVSFTYGGTTYTLPYTNISAYDMKPVYAEDGYTLIRYEVNVAGSALISDNTNTYTDLVSKFQSGTGRVDNVFVSVTTPEGTENLLNISHPDTMRGPTMSISVTEISGRRACVVNFTISAALSSDGNSQEPTPYPIISHRWTSSFALDAGGHVTRTVSGVLVVDLAATGNIASVALNGSTASVTGKAPWADLFRRAVAPLRPAPLFWTRQSQTFAYNEAGNSLIYEIVDSQARTAMPNGAFTGTAEFTYERNRQQLTWASLRFSCELEGSVNGDVRHLIWSAVCIAQSRIIFKHCKIMRLAVTEQEMLKKAKVRVEIDALAPAIATDIAGVASLPVPLAAYIGKILYVVRSTNCPFSADPYGSYRGVAGVPHWFDNETSAKNPIPQTIAIASCIEVLSADCPLGTPTVNVGIPETMFDEINTVIQAGPFKTSQALAEFNEQGQSTSVEQSKTTTNVNTQTRMHRLQTLYTEGSDFVFQTGKASVTLEETTVVSRVNVAPIRTFRPIPAGFVVINDDWKVNHGDIDPSGQRTFIGVYTRTLQSYDGGGATSFGYSTVAGRRQWWPSGANPSVAAPLALGYNLDIQNENNSVLALGSSAQAYQVGTAQDYA
tara:strand:- start:185 stop:2032 length:1848 start_codon:yes stop_codon:yes gene_type:complete